YRYNAHLPMVITTSSTLDEIDPRIRSRMLDTRLCTIFAISAPSYRAVNGTPQKPRTPRKSTRPGG
ncbi:MAG: hypothetical protein HGA28_07295, partial [Anaerolineaceae bacterium]|nr:hypothetical protein [Anaerolineaceae bacterium]